MTPSVNITSDAWKWKSYTGMSIRGSDGSELMLQLMVYHLMIQNPMLLIGLICQILRVFQVFRFSVGRNLTKWGWGFWRSINVSTKKQSQAPKFKLSNSFGSYGTLKNSISFSTGRVGKYFELSGNLSKYIPMDISIGHLQI